jgi:propionyl-CoA synthetase
VLQRDPSERLKLVAGRDSTGRRRSRQAEARRRACRSRRPTRSTSSTPRARPASPRAWCATPAATLVALKWSMRMLYDVKPGEVFWAASDVGWVVGHLHRLRAAAARLHDDPLRGQAGRHAGCRRVLARDQPSTRCGAVHRADGVPRDQAEDPDGQADRELRSVAFPRAVPRRRALRSRHVKWAEDILKVPVIDHWWQTETGWAIAAIRIGLGMLAGEAGLADQADAGLRAGARTRRPSGAGGRDRRDLRQAAAAAGLPADAVERRRALLRELSRRVPGYYKTGDAGYIDEDGYVFVMAAPTTSSTSPGHRLSTGRWRRCSPHPDVAECAVIGAADELKGQVPLGFVVLKAGVNAPMPRDRRRGRALVRERIGPVAASRGDRRQAPAEDALGQDPARHDAEDRRQRAWKPPATIDDPDDPRRDQ